ncbi:MAG: hypothetical protein AseanaTS_07820 [Candidatus Pelagadaptatus aseana]|uniref:hypothetical protein n=1 Tax=Candidatus Pelagadaptatus aseana TaxID=3120508 RepID=UPI0039B179C7
MKIKQELYFYVGIFISVIIVTSLVTYYPSTGGVFGSERGGYSNKVTAPLGLFAGHDICIEAIHKNANGKVITLTSDDRTAKYQGYNDSNQITFIAEVQPPNRPFLSEQRSTVHVSFRCTTSAKTNKLLSLSQHVDDIHGINQQ